MTTPAGPTPNIMPGAGGGGGGTDPAPQTPPAATPPAPEATPQQTPAAQPQGDAPKPPWEANGETFDPERAWNLIQNVKSENAQLKTSLADAKPILDAHEQQRRDEQGELTTAREDLTKAAERETAWRTRAISAEAKTLAGDRFIDADAALALIGDVSGFVDGDNVDTAKITAALDRLATEKPHLVKQPPPQGFTPNRGQGQTGSGGVSLDEQIKAAQASGNILQSIALKQQKHLQNR